MLRVYKKDVFKDGGVVGRGYGFLNLSDDDTLQTLKDRGEKEGFLLEEQIAEIKEKVFSDGKIPASFSCDYRLPKRFVPPFRQVRTREGVVQVERRDLTADEFKDVLEALGIQSFSYNSDEEAQRIEKELLESQRAERDKEHNRLLRGIFPDST